jgi:hypothetical protein
METKVWDNSFSKEDVEVLVGRALTEAEWDSVVDALYNDDDLYNEMATKITDIALDMVGIE